METIPSAQEAGVLTRLLAEEFPDTFAWLSFSCKDEEHICDGTTLKQCVDFCVKDCKQCVAVGVNCTSPQYIESLLHSISDCSKVILAYPNSGEGWDADRKTWLPETGFSTNSFSALVEKWRAAGASMLGGCCRTTPKTILEIRSCFQKAAPL
mmetsp:Transcript_4556/g.16334  ORF Transcript_4556/g.16334 Transcript_4556/m.16334 type:complete len:153 (+) Transcript_4556:899-1357(+)